MGGDATHNAVGAYSQMVDARQFHLYAPGASRRVEWPLEIGGIPASASAFQPRAGLRAILDAARAPERPAAMTLVLSGGGGVGKTQLAAHHAADAARNGTDLVLWAPATEVQHVITLYAHAAGLVDAPGARGSHPEEDARAFLSWLATTSRSWLVVLDDVADPAGMERWWPAGRPGTGSVLATTRLYDARLTGAGRRRVEVDVFHPEEAHGYLRTRLRDDGCGALLDDAVDDLARELGFLPLALGHAAAYMINQGLSCTTYLDRFRNSGRRLDRLLPPDADTEGYGRPVSATLLLSLDAAQQEEPRGLALPVLRLAALLDPAGHPRALWDTPDVLRYLALFRTGDRRTLRRPGRRPVPVTAEAVHDVLRTLHRYGLITGGTDGAPRSVRCHALTGRAVRETGTHEEDGLLLGVTAAKALLRIWPEPDEVQPDLAATLRGNASVLDQHLGDALWHRYSFTILDRTGQSLRDAGLLTEAVVHSRRVLIRVERLLGADHPDTRTARGSLALCYRVAHRHHEALPLEERELADTEREFGPGHPETVAARAYLLTGYQMAGLRDTAGRLEQRVRAELESVRGADHPCVLTARHYMAGYHSLAGHAEDVVTMAEQLLAESERDLGPEHLDTIEARARLAHAYKYAGRPDEAVTIEEHVLALLESALDTDHPDVLQARVHLAESYRMADRADEAVVLQEQVHAVHERVLGPEHPTTLHVRSALGNSIGSTGRLDEAIDMLREVLAQQERLLGTDHLMTAGTRLILFNVRLDRVHADAHTVIDALRKLPADSPAGLEDPALRARLDDDGSH
ncbi:tetratricopeptide repeat protein [Streptomyces pratensis]|uniref:tetratricopeptide repeat protein n=1 Tax=Streptomyces pratensis TaxID=1169025 RepID=UPI0037B3042F